MQGSAKHWNTTLCWLHTPKPYPKPSHRPSPKALKSDRERSENASSCLGVGMEQDRAGGGPLLQSTDCKQTVAWPRDGLCVPPSPATSRNYQDPAAHLKPVDDILCCYCVIMYTVFVTSLETIAIAWMARNVIMALLFIADSISTKGGKIYSCITPVRAIHIPVSCSI